MIKVTDLRINNLINYRGAEMYIYSLDRGGHTFFKINDIAINKETGCTIDGGEQVYSGIPITESWLLKHGFTEDVPEVFVKGVIDLERLLRDSPKWGVYVHEKGIGRTIEFIHELQNIYHALTGEELQDVVNAK